LGCNANRNDISVATIKNQRYYIGTMVGTFDNGNSFFLVGTFCQLSITTNDTQLKLYCWDQNKDNNSGAITAYIRVSQ
jgi:hypothetical protein